MFERFTDGARRVIVLAQEEARLRDHNYIGTEHLLLALVREDDRVIGRALESVGVTPADVRARITESVQPGQDVPSGHIPFTARAKKVLELSLRESLQLGHDYIGTEHILLGLTGVGEGAGAQVLVTMGVDLKRMRQAVLNEVGGDPRRHPRAAQAQAEEVSAAPPRAELVLPQLDAIDARLSELADTCRTLADEVRQLQTLLRERGSDPQDGVG